MNVFEKRKKLFEDDGGNPITPDLDEPDPDGDKQQKNHGN